MNIRSLIKLVKSEVSSVPFGDRNYDNPYEYKLEIWHGPIEMPYRECVNFTPEEIDDLIVNIEKLYSELTNARPIK